MRYRYVNLILVMTIFILSNLTGSIAKTTLVTSSLPRSHIIPKVPLYKQLNGLDCGPASIEMVFAYWGVHIDQKAIADVARTSSNGTYTLDIVRTGHFSQLSGANGSFFPHDAPTAGFTNRPLGYASFCYSSDKFWLYELEGLIASNIPVILLMKYATDDDTGHYRVIVGYDEDLKVVYLMDPWDRGMGKQTNPDGTITWKMDAFQKAWDYPHHYGNPNHYWGAVLMPWSVSLHTTGRTSPGSVLKVTAVITYPCPEPFDRSQFRAEDACASIEILQGDMSVEGSPNINIGEMPAGSSVIVSWNIRLGKNIAGSSIKVSACGRISGYVPDVRWNSINSNGYYYPAYNYQDLIGGEHIDL